MEPATVIGIIITANQIRSDILFTTKTIDKSNMQQQSLNSGRLLNRNVHQSWFVCLSLSVFSLCALWTISYIYNSINNAQREEKQTKTDMQTGTQKS